MQALERVLGRGDVAKRKLGRTVERYPELGGFDVLVNTSEATILQSRLHRPNPHARLSLLVDFDGTIADSNSNSPDSTTSQRLRLYQEYARNRGITASDSVLTQFMAASYEFSRWKEVEGGDSLVHPKAQMVALQWASDQLVGVPESEMGERIQTVVGTLSRINGELSGHGKQQHDDPFYFQIADKKLVTKGVIPWSKGIESVFLDAQAQTAYFGEVGQAMSLLHEQEQGNANLAIFTSADDDQVIKVLDWQRENPDVPVNQIFISKIPKGRFLERLGEITSSIPHEEQFVNPLGDDRDTVVFDDSVGQGLSISQAGLRRVNVVRSKRPDTKEGDKHMPISVPEVDFSQPQSPQDLVNVFQLARRTVVPASRPGKRSRAGVDKAA